MEHICQPQCHSWASSSRGGGGRDSPWPADEEGCHHHPAPLPPIPTRTAAHRILGATVVETAGLRLPVFPGCVSFKRGGAGEGLPPSERETDICYQPPSVLGFPQAIVHLGSRRQLSDPASTAATWLTAQLFVHPRAVHASESQARTFAVGTLHRRCPHLSYLEWYCGSLLCICLHGLPCKLNPAPPGPFRGFLHLPPSPGFGACYF